MPFLYAVDPNASSTTPAVTHATPLTANDVLFVKPGTRNIGMQGLYLHGRGAALTAISGITMRAMVYPTTASATGTGTALVAGTTMSQRDPGAQANKFTGSFSLISPSGITAGTGTLAPKVVIGCGAAGPGGWVAANADSMPVVEGSANSSLDFFSSSGTASLPFILNVEVVE